MDSKQLQQRLDVQNWNFYRTDTGQLVDRLSDANQMQAEAVRKDWVRRYNLNDNQVIMAPATSASRYEIVDRRTGEVVLRYRAADAEDAGDGFNNWLRNQGMPIDTENYGYRPEQSVQDVPMNVAQNFEQSQQVRMPNGIPVWELYDRETGSVLHAIADHTEREAHQEAMAWLRSYGAEDPSTYEERFAVRPKMLQPGERNLAETLNRDQKIQTQLALDKLSQQAGFKNFAAVPVNSNVRDRKSTRLNSSH